MEKLSVKMEMRDIKGIGNTFSWTVRLTIFVNPWNVKIIGVCVGY